MNNDLDMVADHPIVISDRMKEMIKDKMIYLAALSGVGLRTIEVPHPDPCGKQGKGQTDNTSEGVRTY